MNKCQLLITLEGLINPNKSWKILEVTEIYFFLLLLNIMYIWLLPLDFPELQLREETEWIEDGSLSSVIYV
jgi:hypothetical protein